jgi:hypothetical protein
LDTVTERKLRQQARDVRLHRRGLDEELVPVAMKAPPVGILLTFIWLIGTSVVLTRRSLRQAPRASVATA